MIEMEANGMERLAKFELLPFTVASAPAKDETKSARRGRNLRKRSQARKTC